MSDIQRHSRAVYFLLRPARPCGGPSRSERQMLTRLLAMVALITAAGTTGVFVGRAQRSPDAGWQRGYSAGVRAERNAERHEAQRVAANYQPGAAGYTSIYAKGRREGQRLGRKLGRSE